MDYAPTKESLATRPLPEWFADAKYGVFIHWGLYSVPGWAPLEADTQELMATEGPAYWLKHNPYAEWYWNTIQIPGSPSQRHHLETYGPGFSYDDFKPMFNRAAAGFDADSWAGFFKQAQARYVVLTTKHHDGFTLWPSRHPNPHKDAWHADRDLVGDVTSAVRERGMKMGLYYSGGYDWAFDPAVITDLRSMVGSLVQTDEYARYADPSTIRARISASSHGVKRDIGALRGYQPKVGADRAPGYPVPVADLDGFASAGVCSSSRLLIRSNKVDTTSCKSYSLFAQGFNPPYVVFALIWCAPILKFFQELSGRRTDGSGYCRGWRWCVRRVQRVALARGPGKFGPNRYV